MATVAEVKQHILDLCEQLATSNIEDIDAVDIADLARAYNKLTDAESIEHGMKVAQDFVESQMRCEEQPVGQIQIESGNIVPFTNWIDRFNNSHKE